jgi:hypothetical protein
LGALPQLYGNHRSIADVFSIGKSYLGKDIWCVRLTNETNGQTKTKILFVGYHHATERISAELPLYFVVQMVTDWGSNNTVNRMLNFSEIYVIVALNVDGFEANEVNNWQRKNLHPYDEDYDGLLDEDPPDDVDGDGCIEDLVKWTGYGWEFVRWEGVDDDGDGLYNEDWIGGTDLNRNYGYEWNASCDFVSPNPEDGDYRGPEAFSEPETQAIRDLTLAHDFTYALSFHSGGQWVTIPWIYTLETPPDNTVLREVAGNLSGIVGYPYPHGGVRSTVAGTWDDWMYGNCCTLAFTCEIYRNMSALQYEPYYDDFYWEHGGFFFYNPAPQLIENTTRRWMPTFTYIVNRAIDDMIANPPNIAVTDVSASKEVVGHGCALQLSVAVENQGYKAENVNLSICVNETLVTSQVLTIRAGHTFVFNYTWVAEDQLMGDCAVWACADPVPDEFDVSDNINAGCWVKITVPGDVDGDFNVDIIDVVKMTRIYKYEARHPDFDPNADINGDGVISILDVVICTSHYGQKWP